MVQILSIVKLHKQMLRKMSSGAKLNTFTIVLLSFVLLLLIHREFFSVENVKSLRVEERGTLSIESSKQVEVEKVKVIRDTNHKGHAFVKRALTLDDIHITLKTTKKNLNNKLQILLRTWLPKARSQTHIITDELDKETAKTGFNWHPTKCGSNHKWGDLSCKTAVEYQTFKDNPKKWWCHLDDDIYLNPTSLVSLLRQYDYADWYYIGRLSRPAGFKSTWKGKDYTYLFVHGGIYCMSRSLALEIAPYMRQDRFVKMSVGIRRGDDVTIGLIVNGIYKVPITEPASIHTHAEDQTFVDPIRFKYDIAFNYAGNTNTISFGKETPRFSSEEDPTRFYSLHCLLYPRDTLCLKTTKKT